MADKKISQLSAASTPLAGTEVLPIVQSGSTVKVSVADLTAGRSIAANRATVSSSTPNSGNATITANVQYGNAGDTSTAIRVNLNSGTGGSYLSGYISESVYGHNNEFIAGSGVVARDTSASRIVQASGNIQFFTDTSLTAGNVFTPTERVRIQGNTGRVGIGTDSPNALLDVRGAAIFNENGADADFRVEGDNDANLLFIDASTDRIGVGTGSPTVKFDVSGDSSLNGAVVINEAGADKDTRIEGDNDANLLFVDASTDRIGVGTNTPTVKFDVSGDSSLNGAVVVNEAGADKDFRVEGDTNANLIFADASADSVGIGTSSLAAWARTTVDGQMSATNAFRYYTASKSISTGATTDVFSITLPSDHSFAIVQYEIRCELGSPQGQGAITSGRIALSKLLYTADAAATVTQDGISGGASGGITSVQVSGTTAPSGRTVTFSVSVSSFVPSFNENCSVFLWSRSTDLTVAAV